VWPELEEEITRANEVCALMGYEEWLVERARRKKEEEEKKKKNKKEKKKKRKGMQGESGPKETANRKRGRGYSIESENAGDYYSDRSPRFHAQGDIAAL
jgi:hypothetical protein